MTMGFDDIEHREFTVAIRGYEQEEVRAFLRQLAQRWRDPAERGAIDRAGLANQEFVVGLRGYDRDEVRAFLREVAAEADDRSDEEPVSESTANTEPAVDPFVELGSEVASVLRTAQDAAHRTLEASEQQAEEVRARARADAERIVAEARTAADAATGEAEDIRARARADAERIVAEAEERATRAEERATGRLEELRRALADALDRLEQVAQVIELARGELAAGAQPGNGAPEHAPSSLG
jgi:DivIVA domain-containing protein